MYDVFEQKSLKNHNYGEMLYNLYCYVMIDSLPAEKIMIVLLTKRQILQLIVYYCDDKRTLLMDAHYSNN